MSQKFLPNGISQWPKMSLTLPPYALFFLDESRLTFSQCILSALMIDRTRKIIGSTYA